MSKGKSRKDHKRDKMSSVRSSVSCCALDDFPSSAADQERAVRQKPRRNTSRSALLQTEPREGSRGGTCCSRTGFHRNTSVEWTPQDTRVHQQEQEDALQRSARVVQRPGRGAACTSSEHVCSGDASQSPSDASPQPLPLLLKEAMLKILRVCSFAGGGVHFPGRLTGSYKVFV